MKRYMIIILLGVFAWIAANTILYPMITSLVFEKGYPVVIYHIYSFLLYATMGLLIGWTEKSRGWLLSLILGLIITGCFVGLSLTKNFVGAEAQDMGHSEMIVRLSLRHMIFVAYLTGGGFLGGIARKRLTRREMTQRVTS